MCSTGSQHNYQDQEMQPDKEPEADTQTEIGVEPEVDRNSNQNWEKDRNKTFRKRKDKKPRESFLDIKRKYYEQNIAEKIEKRNMLRNYLEKKEENKAKRHAEIMESLKNSKN